METSDGKLKGWFQDNLRIIISIIVVVAIAGGIYSYSKRSQVSTVSENSQEETSSAPEKESAFQENQSPSSENKTPQEPAVSSTSSSQAAIETSLETETSFVEVAERGEGKTHLARRALADYLEKNPDSELTKEHKIFIEDYLRKKDTSTKGVRIGTSIEFQKDLIKQAIEKSKNLSEGQLNNLKKFSQRVPSLS